jgi:hypothetical protein
MVAPFTIISPQRPQSLPDTINAGISAAEFLPVEMATGLDHQFPVAWNGALLRPHLAPSRSLPAISARISSWTAKPGSAPDGTIFLYSLMGY